MLKYFLPDGVAAFRAFLKTEFSEENLEFWLACEEFKKIRSTTKLATKAHRIFEEFVDVQAPREVSRWKAWIVGQDMTGNRECSSWIHQT